MAEVLLLRLMTEEETGSLRRLAPDQKVEAHLRDRARICWLADHDRRVTEISATVGIGHRSNDRWNHHFTAEGLAGLADGLQRGRPPTYTPKHVGTVVATSLTPPQEIRLPLESLTSTG